MFTSLNCKIDCVILLWFKKKSSGFVKHLIRLSVHYAMD